MNKNWKSAGKIWKYNDATVMILIWSVCLTTRSVVGHSLVCTFSCCMVRYQNNYFSALNLLTMCTCAISNVRVSFRFCLCRNRFSTDQ